MQAHEENTVETVDEEDERQFEQPRKVLKIQHKPELDAMRSTNAESLGAQHTSGDVPSESSLCYRLVSIPAAAAADDDDQTELLYLYWDGLPNIRMGRAFQMIYGLNKDFELKYVDARKLKFKTSAGTVVAPTDLLSKYLDQNFFSTDANPLYVYFTGLNSVSDLAVSVISDADKSNVTKIAEGNASDFASSKGKAFKGMGFAGHVPNFDPTDCAEDLRPVKLFTHFKKTFEYIERVCSETVLSMSHKLAATVVVYNDLSKVSEIKTKCCTYGKDLTIRSHHLDQIKNLLFTNKGMGASSKLSGLSKMSCEIGVVTGLSTAEGHFHDAQGKTRGIIEAKDSTSSPTEALRQAAAEASNVAYSQLQMGVAIDDIVVPVLGTNGLLIQLGAVYMLKPSFPAFTVVSKVLDLSDEAELLEAARAIGCIKVMLTQPLVIAYAVGSCPKQMYYTDDSYHSKSLNLFFASTGNIQTSLYHYFRVMGHVHKDADCRARTVFPICVREFNDDLDSSRLLYPKLSNEFRIGLPNTEELRTAFLKELKAAVVACHKIGVVHLDLYLSNVMWRVTAIDAVELKIIDWDAAHFVHEPLSIEVNSRLCQRNGRRVAVREKWETQAGKLSQSQEEIMCNYDWSLIFLLEKYLDEPSLQSADKVALDKACVSMLQSFLLQN